MECRICLEEKCLLADVCSCKGTQRYIHLNCLINTIVHLNSNICPTCKTQYNFNPSNSGLSNYFNSKEFIVLVNLFNLVFYQYNNFLSIYIYLNSIDLVYVLSLVQIYILNIVRSII